MILSFVIPILLWCFIAYSPFLWKVDYKLTVSSQPDDRAKFGATYVEGDSIDGEFYEKVRTAIREDNDRLSELKSSAGDYEASERSIRSGNKRILRSFAPVLIKQGLMDKRLEETLETKEFYKVLYSKVFEAWRGIFEGSLSIDNDALSNENVEIVKKNWEQIAAVNAEYDSKDFISTPLWKLIPEGEKLVGRPSYLPAPHEVIKKGWEDITGHSELGDLNVLGKYWESLKIVFIGFLVACVIGLPVALLAGAFDFFSKLIEPFVDFFRYMPAPAFSTVLIAIFGLAQAPKIALVVIGTLPHLILMVAITTRSVDGATLDAAQTLGAKRMQMLTKVIIPAILPSLYDDLRILLGWAWTWLVIAELIGMKSGLSEIIDTQGRRFQFEHVYPVILMIGITGFLTDQILAGLRGVFFPWTENSKVGLAGKIVQLPIRLFKWLRSDSVVH